MTGAPPGLSAVDPGDPGRPGLSSAFGTSAAGSLRGLLSPRRTAVRSVDPVDTDASPRPAATQDETPEETIVEQPRKRPARRPQRPAMKVRDRKDVDLLLLAVAREGAASGREFLDQVHERSGGAFDLSERSVYHQLHRLRNDRLIRDTGRGEARRFVLTSLGERVLATRVRDRDAFVRGLDRVLDRDASSRDSRSSPLPRSSPTT